MRPGEFTSGLKKSHVEIYVGESDNIIRKVVAELVCRTEGLRRKKVEIELEMTLGKVNEKQAIAAPAKSQPLAGLFSELGINPDELLSLMQGGEGAGGLGGLLEGITGGLTGARKRRKRLRGRNRTPLAGKLEGIHRMPRRSGKRLGNPEVRVADGIAA